MANEQRGEVDIKIGGKNRTLRFGFNEIAQLEQRLEGRSVLRLMAEGNFGLWALREALYVGLLASSPKITPGRVGEWVGADMANIGYYSAKIGEALAAFMPKGATEDDDEVIDAPAPLAQAEEPAKSEP